MAPDQTTLFGDRRLIEIAVGNLLGNATKYSPAGTTIRITLRRDPDGFEITVADRGNGVPPAERDRSEEHTSELQSLMRISYAVFCLKKKKTNKQILNTKK